MSASPVITQELRALLVCDALPAGCIAKPVKDDSLAPHLRPGELAIVDTTDCDPIHGELFFVAWTGSQAHDGSEDGDLVQAYRRELNVGATAWWVGSMQRPRPSAQAVARALAIGDYSTFGWSNGPYRDGILERQIRGRVIGVLAPGFKDQLRLKGGAA
ncbi:S24 family peptidase [Methylobacterium sp. 77]|uniref:S24 family peptidase n=1 Tax=Methylobacterium sp. 77 TaxID=1101192 RepID=UPI000367C93C|nr:S24 family peptidase [Methylobacterium sp. 77]